MEKSVDVFAWTHQLECPPAICNDSVIKILRSGLVGLLWDDLADIICSAKKAETIRKNILLYHLKKKTTNKVIDSVKHMLQLKLDRNNVKTEIAKLEEEYEQQDYIVRQKSQKLREISSKRHETRVRRDLLKLKNDQTCTQLSDHNDMTLVCQHLRPNTCKDLDPKVLAEMLDIVTSLWTGANKKHVWDIVSSNLEHIEVSTLWVHLYQNLNQSVDALIKLETMKPIDTHEARVNIGTAQIYGQHISMVSKQLLSDAKANTYQQKVLEYIEKIEAASNNTADTSEWLSLALEVQKLETEQHSLQGEIDKIQENLNENNTFIFDLAELTSEIQNVDAQIGVYIQDVQQSLNLLKSAPMFIIKTQEKLNSELEQILLLRAKEYDSTMLDNDLNCELDIFQNTLDLNALRKIFLKGDIRVCRYTKSCFSDASVPITNTQIANITSYFPFVQIPMYSLIECYKNIMSSLILKKLEYCNTKENIHMSPIPISSSEESFYTIAELLNLSKLVNTKTRVEIDEFNDILKAWVTQAVQKVMGVVEKTVDDATFTEWTERYEVLSYMYQKSE